MPSTPTPPRLKIPSYFAGSLPAWDLPKPPSTPPESRKTRPRQPTAVLGTTASVEARPSQKTLQTTSVAHQKHTSKTLASTLVSDSVLAAPRPASVGLSIDERMAAAKQDNWKLVSLVGFFALWIGAVLFFLFRYVAT